MKALLLVLGLLASGSLTTQAQISSVTRRTIQHPAGGGFPANRSAQNAQQQQLSPQPLPPILTPQPAPARPAVPFVIPPSPPKSDAEKAAERERVVEFEKQCAEKGMASFQYSLGMRYLVGNGVGQDVERGRKLLEKAAAQGEDKAKQRLTELDSLLARAGGKNSENAAGKKPAEIDTIPRSNPSMPDSAVTPAPAK